MTFTEIRSQIGEHLKGPHGERLWNLMCGLRGPDSPSERPDMPSEDRDRAYRGRRERKYKTVEVIREAAFFGAGGGSARRHHDTKVLLPPIGEWDHFDKHVERAARVLGLEVVTEKRKIVGVETTIYPLGEIVEIDNEEEEEEPEHDEPDE